MPEAFYYYRQDNINSSINNKAKVYCASEEYQHVYEHLLHNPKLYSSFIGIYFVRKFHNYNYTLKRIAPNYKQEFIEFFSNQFKESYQKGEIDESLFQVDDLTRLHAICSNPLEVLKQDYPITIVFGTDDNYLPFVSAAIESIKEHANASDYYEIHIFYEHLQRHRITSVLSAQTAHFKIIFDDITSYLTEDYYYNVGHFSKAMYYRWLIPEILSDREKVLYLDSDLMLLRDCAELYNTDIGDCIIGAAHNICNSVTSAYVTGQLKLPIEEYFNSGVLLINCNKFKNFDTKKKCCLVLKDHQDFHFPDQDVLNLVLNGNVYYLDVKWNCQWNHLFAKNTKYSLNEKEQKIFDDALIDTGIIHFASPIKPWNKPDAPFASKFWETAAKCPLYNDILYSDNKCEYKVSVILPIYNMQQYLSECLDTVFAQSLNGVEVVCVNDGSTDGTQRILDSYKKKHKNMLVITTQNQGVGAARNTGIMHAHGEYVAFMDPDDWYPNHSVLEKLYKKAKENHVLICGGSFIMQKGDELISTFDGLNRDNVFYEEGIISYYDYQFDYSFHRFIYNRKFLMDNKLLFPNYSRYQDPQFFVRAMTLAHHFYAIVDITYKYRCEHKSINWTYKKVNDLLLAFKDILLWSKAHKYAKLHYLTYMRLSYEYQKVISDSICQGNAVAFGLATQLNTIIDYNLLRKYDSSIQTKNLINPIYQIYSNYILNKNGNNDIIRLQTDLDNIKKSYSFRIGQMVTYVPRKIRNIIRKIKTGRHK